MPMDTGIRVITAICKTVVKTGSCRLVPAPKKLLHSQIYYDRRNGEDGKETADSRQGNGKGYITPGQVSHQI